MNLSRERKINSSQRLSMLVHYILIKPLAFLNKNPIILKTGSFHLVYFGLFASLGFMASVCTFFFYLHARSGIADLNLLPIALSYAVGDMIGVKIFYFFKLGRNFFQKPLSYLNETTMYNQGGLFGVLTAGVIVALVYDIKLIILFDALALSSVLGLFFGRLGCCNYGCCFGKPTDSPVHIVYTSESSKIIRTNPELHGVTLAPTQLFTAYFDLLMFVVFVVLANLYSADGLIALIFIFAFNGFRMIIQKHRFIEQSDLMNFSRVALIYLFAGMIIWTAAFWAGGGGLETRTFQAPLTPASWVAFMNTTPNVLLSMIIAGVLMFIFYGLHGAKLGTHINLSVE